jgi:hypothetical protein
MRGGKEGGRGWGWGTESERERKRETELNSLGRERGMGIGGRHGGDIGETERDRESYMGET